jgi:glycerol-3-phosphate dehydrogenase
MPKPDITTDVAIIGGGIAGLWLLNVLRNRGYSALLFEHKALGNDQTVASQGMIHGGIKYALAGNISGESEAIAGMPDRWRTCLRGEGEVDLRPCTVLSDKFYLWSEGGLMSRMSSFFASKALRGRVEKISNKEGPEIFRDAAFRGQLYRLVDLVLDAPSLAKTLGDHHREAVFKVDWAQASLATQEGLARLELPVATIHPRRLILTAGAGNEALLQQLGAEAPAMQRRPLQQVLVRHEYPHALYAHCMGGKPSPRLTVSSHTTLEGRPVWYLGGDLATEGTDEEPEVLINRARQEMAALFHWVDFGQTEWTTIKLDRAEPRQARLIKPDEAFVGESPGLENVLTAWPTKLTLSPDLGDRVLAHLNGAGIEPGAAPELAPLAGLGRPETAPAPWDVLFS